MIARYMEEATAPLFLSGFFLTPPRNIHTAEKVEIDIQRDDEEVAVVIQDLSAGSRQNENSVYTNKLFTPPIYDEEGTITAYNLIKRVPGEDPFQDPNYGANATNEAFAIFRKLERKIRRAIELQAAQVLQTGTLDLVDENGTTLYALNFQPKATHVATVGTEWAADGATGDPIADLDALAEVVRTDGKHDPNKIVFGTTAWTRFMANTRVRAELDNRRINLGNIAPQARGRGATKQGDFIIGSYSFELWTYNATYTTAAGVGGTKYLAADKLIMLSDGRLDLSFGGIPRIPGATDSSAMAFLPPRISDGGRGIDLSVFAWRTPDGKHLKVSAGTRPLTIPTAIDTFASLDVVP